MNATAASCLCSKVASLPTRLSNSRSNASMISIIAGLGSTFRLRRLPAMIASTTSLFLMTAYRNPFSRAQHQLRTRSARFVYLHLNRPIVTVMVLYRAEHLTVTASADFKTILRQAKLARLLHEIERHGASGYRIVRVRHGPVIIALV
jgi:hypothetical protein